MKGSKLLILISKGIGALIRQNPVSKFYSNTTTKCCKVAYQTEGRRFLAAVVAAAMVQIILAVVVFVIALWFVSKVEENLGLNVIVILRLRFG